MSAGNRSAGDRIWGVQARSSGSASGECCRRGGELRFACETILGLVERDGYTFHEIGVVARTLEPYCPFLPRMFREHRIPFSTTGTRPFLEEPWAKVWWQLAGLHRDNFPVQAMMDILTSPFFRCTNAFSRSLLEDAHWWWRLVRHARVIRGRADWDRLAELAEDPSYVQELLENQVLPPHLAREDVCAFARECMRLIQSFDSCPLSGTVGEITAYFEGLFEACVVLPGRSASLDEHAEGMPDASELTECAGHVMSLLGQWDRLGERISSDLWVERFRELLEEAELPLPGQSQVGVQVMDVMAARGYGFRALLILGLNDQVFPRVVREDALLRDRERRVLAESLGYKVDEKLQGLDEEALLFTLLERSAKDRLFLIHQRADSQGRPLIPSSFLSPDCLKAGEDNASVVHVPLSVLERHRLCDDSLAMTTSQNSLIFAMLQGGGLSVEAPDLGSWGVILSHGRQAMEVLERSALPAGSFDGLVEADHLPWRKMQARGISPRGWSGMCNVLCGFGCRTCWGHRMSGSLSRGICRRECGDSWAMRSCMASMNLWPRRGGLAWISSHAECMSSFMRSFAQKLTSMLVPMGRDMSCFGKILCGDWSMSLKTWSPGTKKTLRDKGGCLCYLKWKARGAFLRRPAKVRRAWLFMGE